MARGNYRSTSNPDVVKRWSPATLTADSGGWVEEPTNLAKLAGQTIRVWKKALRVYRDGKLVTGEKATNRPGYTTRKYVLIELEIGPKVPRVQPRNHKCRAARAKVVGIHEIDPSGRHDCRTDRGRVVHRRWRKASAHWRRDFIYTVGETVHAMEYYTPQNKKGAFLCDKKGRKIIRTRRTFTRSHEECAPGIHFFLTKKEALNYDL